MDVFALLDFLITSRVARLLFPVLLLRTGVHIFVIIWTTLFVTFLSLDGPLIIINLRFLLQMLELTRELHNFPMWSMHICQWNRFGVQ